MQQPPHQPPPYQPPPPGGFGAPGVSPGMPAPTGDRLRAPLQLVIVGAAVAIVRTLGATTVGLAVHRSGNVALYRVWTPLQTLMSIVLWGLIIGAAATLVTQRRPGHQLAMGAAIASGLSLVVTLAYLAGSFVGSLSRVLALLMSLAGAGTVIALALCLREVGKSRERPVDPLAFTVVGAAAINVIVAIAIRLGLGLGGEPIRYVSLLLALGQYGVLIAIALRIMSHVPAAELVMGDPSAYRGPQGAYMTDGAAPEGSLALGFLAGFFAGCIGLGLVLMLAKGRATKRGAGIGFACQTVLGIGLQVAVH